MIWGFGLTFPIGAHDMQIEVNIAVIKLSLIISNLGFSKCSPYKFELPNISFNSKKDKVLSYS